MPRNPFRSQKVRYWLAYSLFLVTVVGLGVEGGLRLVAPVGIMRPRFRADATYGHANWPDATIVQSKPGHYRFRLTTNDRGYRGPMPNPGQSGDRFTVGLLGDSYTFGSGVDDGDEFASVIRDRLGDDYLVLNFGVGSFSLAHQIKQYHLEVRPYAPDLLVVQFSGNDVADNLFEPVTRPGPGDDDFVFHDMARRDGGLKNLLSKSLVQQSQIYNHVRRLAFRVEEAGRVDPRRSHDDDQRLYVELLSRFLSVLGRDQVPVVFISVEESLDQHPIVRDAVLAEDRAGRLRFLDTNEWLAGVTDYASPEGHLWGSRAHAIIGSHLGDVIMALVTDGSEG